MVAVRGSAIAVGGCDPDERRVAHRRRGEVEERIVVRALALHATEAEALGGQAA